MLNMMHDDNRLCRANFAAVDSSSHVMSSTMERVDSEQPWSLCSKQAVIDFLEDGRGECLLDRPQKAKVRITSANTATLQLLKTCKRVY